MSELSIFSNVKNTKPDGVILFSDYLENVKTGYWQDQVIDYRAGLIDKSKIKAVTASGRFDNGRKASEILRHSGFIAIDLDQEKNDVTLLDARDILYADEYVTAGHISLGGHGIVLFIQVDPKKHLESYLAIEKYLADNYKVISDPSCKDTSRLRFVSFDDQLHVNREAKKWDIFIEKSKVEPRNYSHTYANRDIDHIIDQVKSSRVDLTDSYFDWMKIGFALASEFGEGGRGYFHDISQFHPDYDYAKADKKYSNFLTSNSNKVHISSLFWIAKQAGIDTRTDITKRIEIAAKVRRKTVGKNGGAATCDDAKKETYKYLETVENIPEQIASEIVEQVFKMTEDQSDQNDDIPIDMQVINYIRSLPLKFNTVTKRCEISGEDITDRDLNSIYLNCKDIFRKGKFSKDYIGSVLDSDRITAYNPFTDFLLKNAHLKPIGAIAKSLDCFKMSDNDYKVFIGPLILKWMLSIIASMNGTYSLLILVLIGEQATGKTKFFRLLLPDELRRYYAESKLDKGTDDELLLSQKLLIVDDEFGGKSKKEATKLKDLSSKDKITARKSYGRYAEDYQRYAVLAGTTNEDNILNDPTGNRRIIPVKIGFFDWQEFEKINKTELFIELYHKWKEVGDWWMLTKDEITELNKFGDEFTELSLEEDSIKTNFLPSMPNSGVFMTVTAMIDFCEKALSKQHLGIKRFGQILKKLGYQRVKHKGIYGYWVYQTASPQGNLGNFG